VGHPFDCTCHFCNNDKIPGFKRFDDEENDKVTTYFRRSPYGAIGSAVLTPTAKDIQACLIQQPVVRDIKPWESHGGLPAVDRIIRVSEQRRMMEQANLARRPASRWSVRPRYRGIDGHHSVQPQLPTWLLEAVHSEREMLD
jgi:hypothetical protein